LGVVEGYETEEQRAARLKREAADAGAKEIRAAEHQRQHVAALVPQALVHLKSRRPPNCMIELVRPSSRKVVGRVSGWVVGKVTTLSVLKAGDFGSGGWVYVALGQDGKLYVRSRFGVPGDQNASPVGSRSEFRVVAEGVRKRPLDVFSAVRSSHALAELAQLLDAMLAGDP
jgi:hypothetical protein